VASRAATKCGFVARFTSKDFPAADASGRRYSERDIEVVPAGMLVITGKVFAEARREPVEHSGLHGKAAD
jgi:hypothetical protein